MWHTVSVPSAARAELGSTVEDLMQATSRNLLAITGGFGVASALVIAGNSPTHLMARMLAVTAMLALSYALAYRLLPRRYLTAQVVWQGAFAIGVGLAVLLLGQAEIALLLALLPLLAVVTLGWPGGLVSELLVVLAARWATHLTSVPPLAPGYGLAMVALGILGGLLAWAVSNPLLTAIEWSLFHFEQARRSLEEAREQRVELKQTQEDLIQANRELARISDRLKAMQRIAEEARQAKAEFVANVSHELRTPLNMIIGFAEVISQSPHIYGKLPAALLTDIGAIQRNSQHLLNLINDVLDLSQVEAGRMALSKEWTHLPQVIEAAVSVVQGLFDSKGLYVKTEVESELPPVYCDPTRIHQVLINLLSNAGRFSERGGVHLRCRREGAGAVISVGDTGPGISEEQQERLFEPFQQVDGSIRRRYGGSGLGLSISKQLVEMHGGRIWLESRLGVGTTISFSLPLEPCNSYGAEHRTGPDPRRSFSPDDAYGYRLRTRPSVAPAPVATPRIVVLDSEHTLQRLLSRYVQDTEIVSAGTLTEAMQLLSRSPAQVLVVNQPPLEELPAGALSSLPYGTPAVTCSLPGAHVAAKRLGVVQYLVKPVTRERLLAALEGLGSGVRSILLVDDEADELQLFSRMLALGEQRYGILQVTNGRRALSMLRNRRPDVMLLDLIMPGMDGFQVLEEKGRDASIRDIPVIVISSRDPTGEPIVSNTLTVTHGQGLSVHSLVACIRAVGAVLSPLVGTGDAGGGPAVGGGPAG